MSKTVFLPWMNVLMSITWISSMKHCAEGPFKLNGIWNIEPLYFLAHFSVLIDRYDIRWLKGIWESFSLSTYHFTLSLFGDCGYYDENWTTAPSCEHSRNCDITICYHYPDKRKKMRRIFQHRNFHVEHNSSSTLNVLMQITWIPYINHYAEGHFKLNNRFY